MKRGDSFLNLVQRGMLVDASHIVFPIAQVDRPVVLHCSMEGSTSFPPDPPTVNHMGLDRGDT